MKRIAEMRAACKQALGKVPRDALVLAVLLLASSASFGLGYLAGAAAGQGSVAASVPQGSGASGAFVASVNGTRYYPVSCALSARVALANRVFFATALDAEAAGYQPASGCGN